MCYDGRVEKEKSKEPEKTELGFSPKPESTINIPLTTDCSITSHLCQCQGKKGLILTFFISDMQLVSSSLDYNRKEKFTWAVMDEMQPKKLFLLPLSCLVSEKTGWSHSHSQVYLVWQYETTSTELLLQKSNLEEKYETGQLKLSRNNQQHAESLVFHTPSRHVTQLYLPGQPEFRTA